MGLRQRGWSLTLREWLGQGLTPPTGLFCSRGDSRKSNRQEETLSTTATATGLKTHAQVQVHNDRGHAKACRQQTSLAGSHSHRSVEAWSVCQYVNLLIWSGCDYPTQVKGFAKIHVLVHPDMNSAHAASPNPNMSCYSQSLFRL